MLSYPVQAFPQFSLPHGCLEEQGCVGLWVMAGFFLTLPQSPNLHFTLHCPQKHCAFSHVITAGYCHPSLASETLGCQVFHIKNLSCFQKDLFCITVGELSSRRTEEKHKLQPVSLVYSKMVQKQSRML